MFEHEIWCAVCGNNFLFVLTTKVTEDFSGFCMVAQSDFGAHDDGNYWFHSYEYPFFDNGALGGGDGSKPSELIPKLLVCSP